MYDRWFSKEELQQLPFAVQKDALAAVWSGLVTEANTLLEQHIPFLTRGRWISRRAGWSAGAGHCRQAGVSHPAERDAQRRTANA